MPFFEGLLYGSATVLLIGPVFFTLLKAALDHGAKGGIAVALGIIVSDLLIVVICVSGLVVMLEGAINGSWMAIAAGVILLGMGVAYVLRPGMDLAHRAQLGGKSALTLFASGFLINFVNPFVFAIWIALVIHAEERFGTGAGSWSFLAGSLSGIFLTDMMKALLAPRLKELLSPRVLRRMHVLIGVAMLLFSIRVFMHAAMHWN